MLQKNRAAIFYFSWTKGLERVLPLLAILLLSTFFACETDIEKVKIITTRDNFPVESAKDAEIIYSDSAIIKVRITAPQLDRYVEKNPYIELPKGIEILFYDEDLEVASQLTADYAISYEDDGRMEARGNVVLINEQGEKLNTEHLIWDEKKELIYSNEFVKITTADEIIMGDGFESNQNFTKFKIKNIQGTITIKDD